MSITLNSFANNGLTQDRIKNVRNALCGIFLVSAVLLLPEDKPTVQSIAKEDENIAKYLERKGCNSQEFLRGNPPLCPDR